MAATSSFIARVYGTVQGDAPWQNSAGQSDPSRVLPWTASQIVNFPSNVPIVTPLPNGMVVGGGYVYSVIEMPPTGLNVHGTKYVSDTSATAIAVLRG